MEHENSTTSTGAGHKFIENSGTVAIRRAQRSAKQHYRRGSGHPDTTAHSEMEHKRSTTSTENGSEPNSLNTDTDGHKNEIDVALDESPSETFPQLSIALTSLVIRFPNTVGGGDDCESEMIQPRSTDVQDCHTADYSEGLLSKINQLRQSNKYCDITLQCGAIRTEAHRNVLAGCSPYFDDLFSRRTTSPTVDIQNVDKDVFVDVINYMYTGRVQITKSNVQSLIVAAHNLQLRGLLDGCSEFLKTQLHPSNCLTILRFSELIGCIDLAARCTDFAKHHLTELLSEDQELMLLEEKWFGEIIKSEHISEDTRLDAIVRWVAQDHSNRQTAVPSLCGCVNVLRLTASHLADLRDSQECWNTSPCLAGFIMGAMGAHLETLEHPAPSKNSNDSPRVKCTHAILVIDRCGSELVNLSSGRCSPSAPQSHVDEGLNIEGLRLQREHCAALELNGLVYVMGGQITFAGRTDDVDVYDIVRGCWKNGPRMQSRRAHFGAVSLDGKIYAVGGWDDNDRKLNSAEVLGTLSGNWRFINPMSRTRGKVSVAASQTCIYAVGESSDAVVECYNPKTTSWTAINSRPTLYGCANLCILNNRLYAFGYNYGTQAFGEVYDTWQPITPPPVFRYTSGLVAHDGYIYSVDVFNCKSIERYDPRKNEWTTQGIALKRSYDRPRILLVRIPPATGCAQT
ncbi:hypothetical protein CRM22_000032 [Opisthorchis felineus]|nr:hypothetical protein CRM22_000032 [Opisthorchis felineus]